MSAWKDPSGNTGNRLLGVIRQAAQNGGLAVSERLDDRQPSWEASASNETPNQSRWAHTCLKTSRMTVLEHVKASEVLLLLSR